MSSDLPPSDWLAVRGSLILCNCVKAGPLWIPQLFVPIVALIEILPTIRHITLVVITGITTLVPYLCEVNATQFKIVHL